jgi:methyl-accepting chemotaxis protein
MTDLEQNVEQHLTIEQRLEDIAQRLHEIIDEVQKLSDQTKNQAHFITGLSQAVKALDANVYYAVRSIQDIKMAIASISNLMARELPEDRATEPPPLPEKGEDE